MPLTIANRRSIADAAMQQPDFRDLMRSDPRRAVARATDRPAPADARITVIEEQSDAWEFVIPAAIDADLPPPGDIRGAVENDVYALLRDEPALRAQAIGAPKAFLKDRLQIDLGAAGINVREEQPGELVLIVPHIGAREELNDDALDLVAGGGQEDTDPNDPSSPNFRPKRV